MSYVRYMHPYTGAGKEPHLFADHQQCLKCGKWEGAQEADDCPVADVEFENWIKVKANCDHLVGYGGDSDGGALLQSERQAVATSCFRDKERWLANGPIGQSAAAVAHVTSLDTPEKALADTFDMFDFCPRCGEKLT